MLNPLAWRIGWRFFRARQQNRFIGFISMSSTVGIALGCLVLLVLLSAMNGFEKELKQRYLGVVSHAELRGADAPISGWRDIIETAESMSGVVAAAPVIHLQGLTQRPDGFVGVQIQGISPTFERRASNIANYMDADAWQSLSKRDDSIVLGAGLAEQLGVNLGQQLVVYLPNPGGSQSGPLSARFTVAGVYQVGGEMDYHGAYINRLHAAELLGLGNETTSIKLRVENLFDAHGLIRDLGYSLDQYLYMSDWTRTQGHLYGDIQLVRLIMYIALFLVIAVACFNIVSTLVMAVRDKQAEIAILATMGLRRRAVLQIFMVQGLTNGLVGTVFGVGAGAYLAWNLPNIGRWLDTTFGINVFSGSVYFIDFLPSQLQLSDVLLVSVLSLLLSFVATLYPAWQATKVQPAQALSNAA
ncbi:lipoprotein-releasing ABC transporter permease subunit [Paraferrimonas sedimenticola]|uniref:Cell division protein FtsX n=1 Tax=Paraferrimonas sedimenticola TaxID=375674 RepID=A0AA37RPR8_9GAMM|nr:lipoprotein-releasing ABC transporter permease subunit [Paraferrimonas sedimenticola]GLP94883.1 cell division protein FtsX [Paraferrimonas sedimenticola]